MKRLFLLFIIFNGCFIKSADEYKPSIEDENKKIMGILLRASDHNKKNLVNYFAYSHISLLCRNNETEYLIDFRNAEDCVKSIIKDNVEKVSLEIERCLSRVNCDNYLENAKLVYDSLSDKYKNEQGYSLMNPYKIW